jgi:hypothetical protein
MCGDATGKIFDHQLDMVLDLQAIRKDASSNGQYWELAGGDLSLAGYF